MKLSPLHPKELKSQRKIYLNNLPFSQEFFLEMQVLQGKALLWTSPWGTEGYLITDGEEKNLLEFHADNSTLTEQARVLRDILSHMELQGAFVKSFDQSLLNALILLGYSPKPGGFLFRRWEEVSPADLGDISESPALEEDFAGILQSSEDFFEGPEELQSLMEHQGLWLYRNPKGKLLGCGLLQPVVTDLPFWDIGMVTSREFRRRGYATLIIQRMKEKVLERGFIPVCGCDVKNTGSLKCLRKAGFREDHLLHYIPLGDPS